MENLEYLHPKCHAHEVSDCLLVFDEKELVLNCELKELKLEDHAESVPFVEGLILEAQKGRTENNAPTYLSSGNPNLDFFFQIIQDTNRNVTLELLKLSWNKSPLNTLKLIANMRDIRSGKGIRLQYFYCLYWLYENEPKILDKNLEELMKFGYSKDSLHLLMMILFNGFTHSFHVYDYDNELRKRRNKKWYKDVYLNEMRQYDQLIIKFYKDKRNLKDISKDELKNYRLQYAKEKFNSDAKYKYFHIKIAQLFCDQLSTDYAAFLKKGSVSLISKWSPSLKKHFDKYSLISSTISNLLMKRIGKLQEESEKEKCLITYTYLCRKEYEKMLAELRKYCEVVESIIPEWSQVNYKRIPSKCMLKNKQSFLNNDRDRFDSFINSKETKVAGAALTPFEIVCQFESNSGDKTIDNLLEKQWKDLVDSTKKKSNCFKAALSVCDVSGSMSGNPLKAAIGLTLFNMELTEKVWGSICITFSEQPEVFRLEKDLSLREKLDKLRGMHWGMNTNIHSVFKLIIKIIKDNKLTAEETPRALFIFTDMEFDCACNDHTNIEEAKELFKSVDCPVPTIILWNLRSSASIPVRKDDHGTILLSGFSPKLLKYILNEEDLANINPEVFMNRVLENKIYSKLEV